MRLILLLVLVSAVSANIFEDGWRSFKRAIGVESEEPQAPERPQEDGIAICSESVTKATVPDMQARKKRNCGCTGPCSHGDSDYLPLFHKLHRGECGCNTKKPCGCNHGTSCNCGTHKPCGCAHGKACGCNNRRPRPPCRGHGHGNGHRDGDYHNGGYHGNHGTHGGYHGQRGYEGRRGYDKYDYKK